MEILRKEDRHITNLLPHLEQLLEQTGAAPYVTAPIVSQEKWDGFVDQMETYTGASIVAQEELYMEVLKVPLAKL
jgi:acyl-CoA oxidase